MCRASALTLKIKRYNLQTKMAKFRVYKNSSKCELLRRKMYKKGGHIIRKE